jgi:CHAD domain-containing protein
MTENENQDSTAAICGYIDRQGKKFLTNLDLVFSGGRVEAVHDVRVASRRLEGPLRLAGERLSARQIGRTMRLLRRTRRAFRIVRDLDVVQQSLCGSPGGAVLEAHDLARLEGALTRERERALDRATRKCRKLDADRAGKMIRRLAGQLEAALGTEGGAGLRSEVEQLLKRGLQRAQENDPRQDEQGDLHQARIQLKRLRYSAELTREVCGWEREGLIPAIIAMQDQLGYWNDQLCAVRRISKIARREGTLSRDSGWSARLLEHCARRAREAEAVRERVLSGWEEFARVLRGDVGQIVEAGIR